MKATFDPAVNQRSQGKPSITYVSKIPSLESSILNIIPVSYFLPQFLLSYPTQTSWVIINIILLRYDS
jgi:hypothetical protein